MAEQPPPYRRSPEDIRKHINDTRLSTGDQLLLNHDPLYPLVVDRNHRFGPEITNIIQQTYDGLKEGLHPPELVSEGIGGTYFLHNPSGVRVSVFKPHDEEANSANNPKGYDFVYSSGDMVTAGRGAAREIAAYYLDHPIDCRQEDFSGDQLSGFSGVPPTVLARCLHKKFNYPEGYAYAIGNYKKGSLQMYMKNDGDLRNEVPAGLSMEEVHKISLLDIRLVNLDRHGGNLLYKRKVDGTVELIPIDHGYCFPKTFDECCIFKWLDWPEAKMPYSEEVIKYIESLDVDKDFSFLKRFGFIISDTCLRVFRISTRLLKQGAKKGLSPFQIGSLLCKERKNAEIVDEGLLTTTEDNVSKTMDSRLQEIPQSAIKKLFLNLSINLWMLSLIIS